MSALNCYNFQYFTTLTLINYPFPFLPLSCFTLIGMLVSPSSGFLSNNIDQKPLQCKVKGHEFCFL